MNQDQYIRANRLVFRVVVAILLLMSFNIVGHALRNAMHVRIIIQMVTLLVALIMSIIVYIRARDKSICGVLVVTCGNIAYCITMLVGQSQYVYVYAVPLIIVSCVFLSKKYVLYGTIAVVAANTIQVIRLRSTGIINADAVAIQVMIMTVVLFAWAAVVNLLTQFHEEQLDSILEGAKAQKTVNEKMEQTADEVVEQFNTAKEMLQKIEEATAANHFTMDSIAKSTEDTARAIQDQATMCSKIQEFTDEVGKQAVVMIETSKRSKENIVEGTDMVVNLKEQSDEVERSAKITEEATAKLNEKVEEVKNIVNVILGISNQTNLLALNASIEAARAGEAGKSFAVVAEEIRLLSIQTKDASAHITTIMETLAKDADDVSESMGQSAQSIHKQSEMIESTKEKFNKIDIEVNELVTYINETEAKIKEIIASTNNINDSILLLSSNSEEVAASSSEGVKVAADTVGKMKDFSSVLLAIYESANKLKQNTK